MREVQPIAVALLSVLLINTPVLGATPIEQPKPLEEMEAVAQDVLNHLTPLFPALKVSPDLRIDSDNPELDLYLGSSGTIVISGGTLRLCFRSDDAEARLMLSFLLSHELAHLARNDQWSHMPRQYLLNSRDHSPALLKFLEKLDSPEARARAELKADIDALSALLLLGHDPRGFILHYRDFLSEWMSQSERGRQVGFSDHSSPEERSLNLKIHFASLLESVAWFDLGTRFYQVGDFAEARHLLRQFGDKFPEAAALNNLALAEIQLALKVLSECNGFQLVRFKLPLLVDDGTLLARFEGRGPDSCYDQAKFTRHRKAAEDIFTRLIERYPDYFKAYVNRASLMILADEGSAVITGMEALRERLPARFAASPEARLVMALGHYIKSTRTALRWVKAHRREALSELARLATDFPDDPDVAFNHARVRDELEGFRKAEDDWRLYLKLERRGPDADRVRTLLGEAVPKSDEERSATRPAPLEPGSPQRAALSRYNEAHPSQPLIRASEFLGNARKLYRSNDLLVYFRENRVQLVERALKGPISQEELQRQYGSPVRVVVSRGCRFWAYRGFGFELREGAARLEVFWQTDTEMPER